jgi:hypothetical protein
MRYAIGDWVTSTSTPGEVLLRLVSQSSQRVELYAGLLAQAYDAAERLSRAEDEAVWGATEVRQGGAERTGRPGS